MALILCGSLITLLILAVADRQITTNMNDQRPVYLVGAATITDYSRLPEYRKIAEPLARKGGYEVIAAANVDTSKGVLLEGEWPAQGLFFIERYESMEKLQSFVNSEEFQQAKLLRDQVADVHFMFALEQGENMGH